MNQSYFYIYYDPTTSQPFYVGKGTNKRAYDHLTETLETTDNPHKYYKIQKLLENETSPIIRIFPCISEEDAYACEELLIRIWKDQLVNMKPGGRGTNKGVKFSKEHKDKIGAANRLASLNPQTKERRRQIFLGKQHTEETKEKIRQAHIGLKASEETKKKMSESRRGENHPLYGKHHTSESIEKMRLKKLGKKMPDTMKEKMRVIQTGQKRNQSTKDAISSALADRWIITFPDGTKKEIII